MTLAKHEIAGEKGSEEGELAESHVDITGERVKPGQLHNVCGGTVLHSIW